MATNINLLPQLPADIIEFQILSRLRVKSLLRFQSVCKPWKLLISSNPYFAKTHLDNSNHDSILLRRRRSEFMPWGDDGFDLHAHTMIIGCINGLVCFFNWRSGCLNELVSAIWNPATRQCVQIPALTDKTDGTPYCVGFGFDLVANDYKVVYVTTIWGQPLQGFIYSYNPDRWKKIAPSNFVYHGTLLNSNQPARVNESLYWLNRRANGIKTCLTVISFDVRHKTFRLLPDSFDRESKKDKVVLVNMRDSVAVIFYDWTALFGGTIDVHIFSERCGEWSKMCIEGLESTFVVAEKLLTCFPNGDILFEGPDLDLYCVSPELGTIKDLKSPEKKGNEGKYYFDGSAYSESLIFLEGMKPWCDHLDVEGFSLEKD
ncbi:putative F-box protein At2g02030 [Apium graveolens]|uniref:putative F-box protein At2g02030 n=1 Tax=Apium graveolens TaxID=4045 RepID=UPI003D78C9B0